jgi:hypothetical protein
MINLDGLEMHVTSTGSSARARDYISFSAGPADERWRARTSATLAAPLARLRVP